MNAEEERKEIAAAMCCYRNETFAALWKRVAKIYRRRWLMKADEWCDGYDDGYAVGFDEGAAVAFGLMGMAEAIRTRCTCPGVTSKLAWEDVCERCKGYPCAGIRA